MHVQNHLEQPAKGVNAVVLTSRWRLVNGAKLYDIRQDPAQEHDIADEHPEVVQSLRRAYDQHWAELGLEEHRPERPAVGGPGSPALRLTADLTRNGNFIWQQAVRKGENLVSPVWLVEVERPGRYRFELRRWPREADHPMTAALPPNGDDGLIYCGHANSTTAVPGKALPIASVELRLSTGQVLREPVPAGARSLSFEVALPAGPLDIEAWFLDPQGQRLTGAYYVYVHL
jgi:arylsulfatase